jgi:Protein of unknown function (DUF3800)
MLLTYFDEVKPQEPGQPYYWLGGLIISSDMVPTLEADVGVLAVECFGNNAGLTRECEFHATNIAAGAKNFGRLRDPARRFAILKRLYQIIDRPDGVFRVTVRLDVRRIADHLDVEALALMFLIEKVDIFARVRKTLALLIGDLDNERAVNQAVQNLSQYRAAGTDYQYGHKIDNVIDTIHFSHSHHSRLLQLADAYLWLKQLQSRTDELSELRRDLLEFVRRETNIGWDHKYKRWPPESR